MKDEIEYVYFKFLFRRHEFALSDLTEIPFIILLHLFDKIIKTITYRL